MSYLIKSDLKPGGNELVAPGDPACAGLEYVSLAVVNLQPGKSYEEQLTGKELVGVILGGQCTVTAEPHGVDWREIGSRNSVFEGKATGFYLPTGTRFRLECSRSASVALCRAPSQLDSPPVLVGPQDVRVKAVGRHNWRREVHDIIHLGHRCQHLVVGETYNPPGNWSSFPPHRHEQDNPPLEVDLEEVYHFRVSPANGFGFQRIYTDDRSIDEVYTLHDGDTVIIPRGYHPVAAAPGHRLYYLWVLAGSRRELIPRDDPNYAWLKHCEPILDSIG